MRRRRMPSEPRTRRAIARARVGKMPLAKRVSVNFRGRLVDLSISSRPGEKKPIVFLPGMGCSKEDIREMFALKDFEGHPILALDFPGQGESPLPDSKFKFTIGELADLTKAVIDQHGLKDVLLVGHSMGAVVGTVFAHKYPQALKMFVNVEGSFHPSTSTRSVVLAETTFPREFAGKFQEYIDECKAHKNPAIRRYGESAESSDPTAIYYYSKSLSRQYNRGDLQEKFLSPRLRGVRRVYVYGEHNRNKHSWLEPIQQSGEAKVVGIPKSGHFVMEENPSSFYAKLKRLIEEFD